MNRRGFIKKGLFALIVISLFILATATIIDQQASVYGTTAESELGNYNKLAEVSGTGESYESGLTSRDPEAGEDPESTTFGGVYGILTNLFTAFNVITGDDGMIDQASTQLGLPNYVGQGVIAMIFIGIAAGLIAIIFRLGRVTA